MKGNEATVEEDKKEVLIKKIVRLSIIIFLLTGVLITSSSGSEGWPRLSISSTFNYILDDKDNCELYVVIRIVNIDNYDFNWPGTADWSLNVPVVVTSYSKERPVVTEVFLADAKLSDYSVFGYNVSDKLTDQTYVHGFWIGVYPPSGSYHPLIRNATSTIVIKIMINSTTSKVGDYNKFILQNFPLPSYGGKYELKNFIIRVNLPNDPYFWVETLDITPKCDFRTSFGRSESLEWIYDKNYNFTDLIFVTYRIHPDTLRKSLDDATTTSKNLGWGALIIASFTLLLTIYFELEKIKETCEKIRSKYRKTKEAMSPLRKKLEKKSEEENRGIKKRALPRKKR